MATLVPPSQSNAQLNAQTTMVCGRARSAITNLGDFLKNITKEIGNQNDQLAAQQARADTNAAEIQQQASTSAHWFSTLDTTLAEVDAGVTTESAFVSAMAQQSANIAPGAPTALTALPGDASAGLEWEAPLFTGTPAVPMVNATWTAMKYSATNTTGSPATFKSAPVQRGNGRWSATVISLDNYNGTNASTSDVWFTVSVTTTSGTSIPSPISPTIRITNVCAPPTNGRIVAGRSSARVEFVKPLTSSGLVFDTPPAGTTTLPVLRRGFVYKVTLTEGTSALRTGGWSDDGKVYVSGIGISDEFLEIPGLTDGTRYRVKVQARALDFLGEHLTGSSAVGVESAPMTLATPITPTVEPGPVNFLSAYDASPAGVTLQFEAPLYSDLDANLPFIISIVDLQNAAILPEPLQPSIKNVRGGTTQVVFVPTTSPALVAGGTYYAKVRACRTSGSTAGAEIKTQFVVPV